MGRRRRSLLGSTKGPILPTPTASEPAEPLEEAATADMEEAPSSEVAPSEAGPSESAPLEPPAPEPEPADSAEPLPTEPAAAPPTEPVGDDAWDALRAPTPPPLSRRGEAAVLGSEEPESEPPVAGGPFVHPPAEDFTAPSEAPADYSRAGMDVALDGLGDDPFAGFDDFDEPPPTEEVAAGLYEDVSTPYSGTMHVPEPPPIPGIVDRFTPPPVERSQVGAHQTEGRPSYLAEPTPEPAVQRQAFKSYTEELADQADEDDEERDRSPVLLLALGGLAVIVALLGLFGVASLLTGGGGGVEAPVEQAREAGIGKNVEVRTNMRARPGLIGVQEVQEQEAEPEPEEGTAEEPEGAEEIEAEGTATEEPPASAPAPAPAATPRPKPAPAPRAAPAPVADLGTLKIRSNRKVLVHVNGKAIGFTPQDYRVAPGDYSVSAMLPGQPDSKQTLDTKIGAAGATVPLDFKF